MYAIPLLYVRSKGTVSSDYIGVVVTGLVGMRLLTRSAFGARIGCHFGLSDAASEVGTAARKAQPLLIVWHPCSWNYSPVVAKTIMHRKGMKKEQEISRVI